jgi:hypothetical protein
MMTALWITLAMIWVANSSSALALQVKVPGLPSRTALDVTTPRHILHSVNGPITRRNIMVRIAGAVVLAQPFIPTKEALADVSTEVVASSAFRSIKSSLRKMRKLEEVVLLDDFSALKESLREAPISEIRKSCNAVIRGADDESDVTRLQMLYEKFIAALEKMDGTASVAMRGRKLSKNEFFDAYHSTVLALDEFVGAAGGSVPVALSNDSE